MSTNKEDKLDSLHVILLIIIVTIASIDFIDFMVNNQLNNEAIERCRPYQVQTSDNEVTVCHLPEGYTVIRNEKQHVN